MKEPIEIAQTRAVPDPLYQPTRLYLYGIELENLTGKGFRVTLKVDIDNGPDAKAAGKPRYVMAIIYGYSYEGHCYSLPRPSIIAVDDNKKISKATGCGYEGQFETLDDAGSPKPVNYSMWLHDKLDETVELVLNRGFMEEIILQQNVAGQKAPAAYSAKVQLAHRGGKLVD